MTDLSNAERIALLQRNRTPQRFYRTFDPPLTLSDGDSVTVTFGEEVAEVRRADGSVEWVPYAEAKGDE